MRVLTISFCIVLLCCCTTSCRTRTIIDSVPRGADVYINGIKQDAKTPCILDMYSNDINYASQVIELRKPGYQSKWGYLATVHDRRHFAWSWVSYIGVATGQYYLLLLETHPAMYQRVQDYYCIYLEDDVSQAVEQVGGAVESSQHKNDSESIAIQDEEKHRIGPIRFFGLDFTGTDAEQMQQRQTKLQGQE